ncbi:PREDICTED: uncharacterized protein LOC104698950 [Camelina sativa]|uniref:Uncharacterized protein LOC104698950 n=1 Tax=Camelina sativa TaxID=90675 RepID=A0ABM0SKT6_CAMSA|nr:PREDICTED: uncharacterized protein LOC104698950 [Camelina sativa]
MSEETKAIMKTEGSKAAVSAFQLASTENPGAIIAQVQFNGENFDEWAQAMRTALRVKKKYGFVDGTVSKPGEDEADYEDWLSEDPKELWMEIKDRFSEGNGPRIQEIKTELAYCCQGNMSVIEYYGKLQMLWEDLANYDKVISCKCGGCSCNINVELEKKREDDRIHQFFLGLDTALYGGVRTSIISTDPLPNMNQVYSKVKSVEQVSIVMRGREQENTQVAFAVRGENHMGGKEEKGKMVCSVCKKSGHTVDTCFQVIGYPEWWSERPRGIGGFARGGGRQGNGRGRGGMARANVMVAQDGAETSGEAERSGYTGLTNEQWGTLVKLLESSKGNTPRLSGKSLSLDWVIDTGATNHMTCFSDLLLNRKYILPCTIGLPNGENSLAKEKGTVSFDDEFELRNVLFVPGLKCNLISVSQRVADLDVVMQIANKGCVIHDRITRSVTGAGELKNGLYFFRRLREFRVLHLNKDGAEDLWHKRLGHPSNGVFDLLPVVGSRNKDFSVCDICLKAKHCREVFHTSDNKSDGVFDMIHVDLWGPYRRPTLCNSYYFLTIVDDFSRGVWVYLL